MCLNLIEMDWLLVAVGAFLLRKPLPERSIGVPSPGRCFCPL